MKTKPGQNWSIHIKHDNGNVEEFPDLRHVEVLGDTLRFAEGLEEPTRTFVEVNSVITIRRVR